MKLVTGAAIATACAIKLLATGDALAGPSYKVLHSFGDTTIADGIGPDGDMGFDASGNLFGSTISGGNFGAGTIFKVSPQGKLSLLYQFAGGDGAPQNGIAIGPDGFYYGVTLDGSSGNGVVYQLSAKGKEKILYSFTGGKDGAEPSGRPFFDAGGDLIGTTQARGKDNSGTMFSIQGGFKVLHTFCSKAGCADGALPATGLLSDAHGNLFGTTSYGGTGGGSELDGVIFEYTSARKFKIFYTFGKVFEDGTQPLSTLVSDAAGNFYGTTWQGGKFAHGIIFQISPKGKLTDLYDFCVQSKCSDGDSPRGSIVLDANGNIFGITQYGGSSNYGVVYELSNGGTLTTLHSFTRANGDGGEPFGGVVADKSGAIYGTTYEGGDFDGGTLFSVTP